MKGFVLTHIDGQKMARTVERSVASGGDWPQGSLLVVDASDEFAECGADPTAVAAVAASGVGADTSGFNRLSEKGFPPGKCQGHWVGNGQKFHAAYVGTLPAAAGGSYGVVKDTDGYWKVDFNEVTTLVVKLVNLKWTESPLNQSRVVVQFLDAVVQDL